MALYRTFYILYLILNLTKMIIIFNEIIKLEIYNFDLKYIQSPLSDNLNL